MDNFLSVIEKFEGIIGTLLGVMMTLILTEVFKKMGRMKFYKKSLDVGYEIRERDSWGHEVIKIVNNKNEASFFKTELTLEIYNSSDTPKILRDVKLVFYNGKSKMLSADLDDKSTERIAASSLRRDKMGLINIKPKEIMSVSLVYYCHDQDVLGQIKKSDKIYLESRDYKNKVRRVFLAEI